ncbi:hypothetical protein ACIOHE_15670 [Streptomyces sp. NPDC087851]|uniref:hypothetical protein n=1 Tax=Streptomyces sp. NPDC087851 TaxID=3365810 RepID=UPI0038230789
MQSTRTAWLPAAHGTPPAWFRLGRHDDPAPKTPEPADPAGPEPKDPEPKDSADDPDPEGADQLGDAGKRALAAMKAEKAQAKKDAAEARKTAADALARVQEFEDRDKSELDKATAKADKAEARAAVATSRAVKAEVKVLAADFIDPTDAEQIGDLSRYVDSDGEIDTDAIASDLAALLERKPHLRKQPAAPKDEKQKTPKPDPGQGPRPPEPPADFRTASPEEYRAALAKYGVTPRR